MKQDYLTRNEAARLLGVSPQTVSNYVERGILVESTIKNKNSKTLMILSSSIERLMTDEYDLLEQSKACQCLCYDLNEKKEQYINERDEFIAARKLLTISEEFHKNINEIAEILTAFLVRNQVLSKNQMQIVIDILNGHSFKYIAQNCNLKINDIQEIYVKALKTLSIYNQISYEDLKQSCNSLEEQLQKERKKNKELQAEVNRLGCLVPDTVKEIYIPEELYGYNSRHISAAMAHSLKVNDIDNLFEVVFIHKEQLLESQFITKGFLAKLERIMAIYGLEYNNIASLRNPKVLSLRSPYMKVSISSFDGHARQV